jgi:hypothetical protein
MTRLHPHLQRTASQDHFTWRRARLVRAGLPTARAASLASDVRIDLDELLKLIDAGCPPELAARIVAPLDASGETS